MKLNITYKLVVRDKNGKVVSEQTTPGHSFVRQFLDVLYGQMLNQSSSSITDILGTSRTIFGNDAGNLVVSVNSDDRGVVLGTGTTAVDIGDNKIETEIDDGTASGELTHGAQVLTAPTTTSQTAQFSVMRPFTNGSGGTIVVTEVGLYGNADLTTIFFCFAREVLGSSVSVLNGQTIDVTAQIQISAA